jgi:glycosyltransferase involved in cell wall biosynthesis
MSKNSPTKPSSNPITFFVVTTLYNSNATIQKTFDSMLSQTYGNLVHYIYDDGSPENPDALVAQYIEAVKAVSPPYTVIYEKGTKNLGVDLAHQHCFQKMSGSFFTWLDSGDYLDPHFFEAIAKASKKHPDRTWFKTDFHYYDNQGVEAKTGVCQTMSKRNLRRKDQLPNDMFGRDVIYSPGAYSVSAFKKVNPVCLIWDAKTTEAPYYDVQIFREFALNKEPAFYIDKPLSFYLKDPHSASKDTKARHNKVDQGMEAILCSLNYPQEKIQFYHDYYGLKLTILDIEGYCLQGQPKKAIVAYHDVKQFLKAHHLPAYYFANKKRSIRFYLFARCPLLLALYKKTRHLQ